MDFIAEYSERHFPYSYTARLWVDKIEFRGSTFLEGDYEGSISLSELSPVPSRSSGRSQWFHAGLFLMIIFGFTAILVCAITASDRQALLLKLLFAGLFFVGAALCILYRAKIETVSFKNRQEIGIISIWGGIESWQQREDFVKRVIDAIHGISSQAGSSGGI